ncbi:MAG TPA: DUF4340 domain-containing protein [Acidimicrobiia bacterium]|nr:DUF4340 domain-containing protein [Acidimicrobiia bacterium]HMC80978.1 DUF4340 domain-containing protein [Acidimicrobiia bacterium]
MSRRRRAAALGAVVLTAGLLTVGARQTVGTGAGGQRRPSRQPAVSVPVILAVDPSAVVAVKVRGRGTSVEVDRTAGGWQPGPRTTSASAALLGAREGNLFPLRAYRMLTGDPTRAEYGLADPELVADVADGAGRSETIEIGAPTFNGEGSYARRVGDPHLYLLTRGAVDGLRAVLRGEAVSTPHSDPERERLASAEQLSDPELITNPWLAQILKETGP